MPISIKSLIDKVSRPGIMKILCTACWALKHVTRDEDTFGHFCAGTVCLICGLLGMKEAAKHYHPVFCKSKAVCKTINKTAQIGEKATSCPNISPYGLPKKD